jgi:hypothetical protein
MMAADAPSKETLSKNPNRFEALWVEAACLIRSTLTALLGMWRFEKADIDMQL